MIRMLNPTSVAAPASAYSHGVYIPHGADIVLTSGTLGNAPDGKLAAGFDAQCRLIFANTAEILGAAEMDLGNVVKITTYLLRRGDTPVFRAIRDEFLPHKPASTAFVVAELLNPEWLVEIEVIAARAAR